MKRLVLLSGIIMLLVGAFATTAMAGDIPRMTVDELAAKIGSSDILVVDVRKGSDWKGSEKKIKGAVYADPKKIASAASSLPKDKTLVFYCA